MKSAEIKILRSGFYTTLQSVPDFSKYHFGVPAGGAMDLLATAGANLLVGNDAKCFIFETTLAGVELEFNFDAVVAVTGAICEVKIGATTHSMNSVLQVPAGSTLIIGKCESGFRTYVAISGEFVLSETSLKPAIFKNQILKFIPDEKKNIPGNNWKPMVYNNKIPVTKGPEFDWMSESTLASLFGKPLVVGKNSGRMACFLDEVDIAEKFDELISSAVLPGTIQLTPGGTPIVLMRDCQTTGGYPRIGVVTEEGMNQLAQVRPGERVVLAIG